MALVARIEIDVRNMEHLKLFVWEMLELRDALRIEGRPELAVKIDDAVRRLTTDDGPPPSSIRNIGSHDIGADASEG